MYIPVEFVSLAHDKNGSPIAILREINGSRELRVVISSNDASRIAILSFVPDKKGVGDLTQDMITAFDAELSLLRVSPEEKRIVKCELFLDQGGRKVVVTPRPGEAIILAIINETAISVAEVLFSPVQKKPSLREQIRLRSTTDFGTYRPS